MATVKALYGSPTAITVGLASLAATAGRECTIVDNTTNLYLDALVQVQVKVDTTAPANDKAVYIYAYGIMDTTTPIYPDAVTGADAAITINSPTQLRLLGTIFAPSASTTYKSEPWSVASLFGGQLPPKWGIVVVNSSSVLTAVAGDHKVEYLGIQQTVA